MTGETLLRANENRKERLEKIAQYNNISRMHDNVSDNDPVWLDKNCNTNQRIYPTVEGLDAEITALDKEFENM